MTAIPRTKMFGPLKAGCQPSLRKYWISFRLLDICAASLAIFTAPFAIGGLIFEVFGASFAIGGRTFAIFAAIARDR